MTQYEGICSLTSNCLSPQIKCEELDKTKVQLAEKEESLRQTSEELREKIRECEQVSQTLKDRDAFIDRLTKGKR